MDVVQRLGAAGAALYLVAAFMPIWGASQGATTLDVSLFEAMRFLPLARDELALTSPELDDAIAGASAAFAVMCVIALLGFVMALFGARRLLLVPALLALAAAGGLLAYSIVEVGRLDDEIGPALRGEIHLAWGWAVHFAAVLMLTGAAVAAFFARPAAAAPPRERADRGDEPPPAAEPEPGEADGWRPVEPPGGWLLAGKDARGRRLRLRLDDADLVQGLVIGRSEHDADLMVDDASVSRAHVRVWPGWDGLVFEDLGSTNGTLIAGRRLAPGAPEEALSGSEITLGDVRFVISYR